MARIAVLALLLVFSVQSLAVVGLSAASPIAHDSYLHKASLYSVRSMKDAQWAYLGFIPRMEDPNRVKIVFSKASYTMRVSAQFTKQEIADYPRYLSQKAAQTAEIINTENITFYQNWRWLHF